MCSTIHYQLSSRWHHVSAIQAQRKYSTQDKCRVFMKHIYCLSQKAIIYAKLSNLCRNFDIYLNLLLNAVLQNKQKTCGWKFNFS